MHNWSPLNVYERPAISVVVGRQGAKLDELTHAFGAVLRLAPSHVLILCAGLTGDIPDSEVALQQN